MSVTRRILGTGPVDWLAALLLSWAIPLSLVGTIEVNYAISLLFWAVPVALLLPRFYVLSDQGARRRRHAFWWSVAYILIAGSILDLVFGATILRFDPRNRYLYPLPAVGGTIPVEELLFYFLGGMAVLLVYFWCDEYWLNCYSVRKRRTNQEIFADFRIFRFSGPALVFGVTLFLVGWLLKWHYAGTFWPPPYYYSFLVVLAFIPAIALYASLKDFVNWRAFSFTALYVLLTACIWEVTLALPKCWWCYKDPPAVIGKYVTAWGLYPIEALLVWLVVSFSSVLTYEAVKAYHYDERPAKQVMFGS
jgi:hypothetical protein